MQKIFKFFYSAVAVLLTAYICSQFTHAGIVSWYDDLPRPPLTPPNMVFPIMWSIIYGLLIFATLIVLLKPDGKERRKANNLFILQLLLQILWCYVFFAQGYLGLGLLIIILLDIAVFRQIVVYAKISKPASWLLYPYYLWLIFATFLNMSYVYYGGLIVVF